ncbi:Non-specific lipid-transfer protein 2 [Capsicum annuum]|uniref:Non-specific lipid-transfer protein 2 n=1 Tax=Capsicum annuum TaxID=4072 RepID=A0A2G2ZC25_CAPAN|nr:Non-specific lipid-transfer protein 2 [Capsicum annuum]KAF3648415.1 Non-specific lipid-transfer protein 2 [Capsicum annuum]PHT79538.1 Non-specific lipid-transfer protein 2 [Capsicum annuum]
MNKASKLVLVTVLVLLLLAEAHVSSAATCSPAELRPCLGAIRSSSAPTKLCCSKIKQQKSCLCQYLKNPALKQYVNSPAAKKVARTCGVPYPRC